MKPRPPTFAAQFLLAVAIALLSVTTVHACNIPVFRFALDRWRPDRYELTLLHDQSLSEQDQRLFDKLEKYADRPDCPANVNVSRVDLSRKHDRAWDKVAKQTTLPCLVLRFPDGTDIAEPIWIGPLKDAPLRQLLDSPARREIARRIWNGASAVWVLLESGDAKKDAAALDTLKESLSRLEKSVKLPELTTSPQDKLLNPRGPKVRIEFSVLKVPRTDAGEDMLAPILLRSEDGLIDRREPMVFPVFGRGIILHALVGKGITERNIASSAGFLCGACSCEVKAQNPGVDLLMTADWETGAEPEQLRFDVPAVAVPSASDAANPDAANPDSASNLPMIRNVGLAFLGAFVFLGVLARRRSQPKGTPQP